EFLCQQMRQIVFFFSVRRRHTRSNRDCSSDVCSSDLEEVMTGITDWTGNNYELMDREMELWDKYPYAVDPTAKATVPLIGAEVPEDIVAAFVEDERAEWVGELRATRPEWGTQEHLHRI